ncbi:MAG: carboxylating nicotinate-nucleotide diphosphorylase [Acidobacteria bacterium]|nr:carboxylating nicotinate-nucleotide diphosphorylase [Acidobacteriota bacterium]
MIAPPPEAATREAVARALAEDLGDAGDVTTEAIVPAAAPGRAVLVAREACVVAGLGAFEEAFRALEPAVKVTRLVAEGEPAAAGAVVARVEGPLRAILAAERTALNFLQRLSGIATLTRRFVEAAPGVQIRDTRKTTPGLRALEKYAVRAGGGTNHRMGLFDRVLVKDNHVAAAGGVGAAIARMRAARPGMPIEVECETLDQVREALEAGADELLLDNMDPAGLREAARLARGRARTEASGGVTLAMVGEIATTGVDAVSSGALTHSAPAVDLALEMEP